MSWPSSVPTVPPIADEVLGTVTEGAVRAGAELLDVGELATSIAAAGGRAVVDSSYDIGSAVSDAASVAARRTRLRHVAIFLAAVVVAGGAFWMVRRATASADEELESESSS